MKEILLEAAQNKKRSDEMGPTGWLVSTVSE